MLLTGCFPILEATFELKIGLQEQWDLKSRLLVPSDSTSVLIDYLNQTFLNNSQFNQFGVNVAIKPLSPDTDGNTPVQLILSGQGYDSFRQTFGENSLLVEEKNGLRTLTVAVDISSWVTTAQTTELTLRGGKILAHNGTLLNETTVQWIDSYGTMTATMQEPSWLDYLPWVILGGGTLLVLFSGIGLLVLWSKMHKKIMPSAQTRSRVKSTQSFNSSIAPSQTRSKICQQCGAQIPFRSNFCPMCGAKQS